MLTEILIPVIPMIYKYGYIAVILCAMLEGASIPFPGSAVLIIIGFLIYKGSMNIWLATFLGALFYSLAAIIPYYIGRSLKGNLVEFLVQTLKLSRKRIHKVEDTFRRYGDASVCISRPFFFGNYISYLAGMAGIHLVKFFLFTYLGILPWVGLYLWLGYLFRGNLYRSIAFIEEHSIPEISVVVFILLVGGMIVFHRIRSK